jgi:CheY-like chemotaxis protein
MMPEMNGFEVAAAIRADLDLPKLTIMMLSSMNLSDNARRAEDVGIASYICKPVRHADLLDALLGRVEHLKGEIDDSARAPEDVPASPRSLRVLLAEEC